MHKLDDDPQNKLLFSGVEYCFEFDILQIVFNFYLEELPRFFIRIYINLSLRCLITQAAAKYYQVMQILVIFLPYPYFSVLSMRCHKRKRPLHKSTTIL